MTGPQNGPAPEGAPPRLATWLVERVVPPRRSRDGLLGDMEERYHRRAQDGRLRAGAVYWTEAFGAALRYGAEAARQGALERREGGMETWLQDLRLAARSARRRPGFTALVVGTLALGIGANAGVFSVVHATLLKALPYESPERLVMADQLQPTGFRAAVSMPNYEDWRDRSTVFDGFSMERPQSFRVEGEGGVEVLEGRAVLGDFFDLLGVEPALGVLPSADELGPGAARVAVLTWDTWQARFGARPDVMGELLRIGGEPHEVVAVLPPRFALDPEVALYVPLGLSADNPAWHDRGTSFGGWVVARMRPGVTVEEAQADLARVTDALRAELGDDVAGAALFSMREWHVGDVRQPVLFLMLGVFLVLLVACANVASLLLGRGEERRGELAVRAALGAGRGRLVRQLLVEALVLGTAGAALGLLLARSTLDALLAAVGTGLPPAFAERVEVGAPVVLVTVGASLAVILLFGLLPAVRATRRGPAGALRRAVGTRPEGARLRGLLVGGEVALSVVLLVCAGLLVRSVTNLRSADTGFSAEGVLTQRLSAPSDRYPDRAAVLRVMEEIRTGVERLPGVTAVASSNLFPFSRTNWEMLFREPSRWPEEEAESVLYTAATPDYFDVFSIRLLRGRLLTEEDRANTEAVVVIDETAAERYWHGDDPIGRRVSVDDELVDGEWVPRWRTIVGVVGHVRNYELAEPSRVEAYVPLEQSACCRTLWLTVRTTGDPAALASRVRDVVRGVDPEIPVFRVNTMRAVLAGETAVHRAVRAMFGVFGGLALLLGAVGIYGVVATGAARRRREIAVRVALGSAPRRAAGVIAAAGLRWVGVGLVVGLLAAPLAARVFRSLLVGVDPLEPSVLAAAAGVLVLSAALAAWLPIRRAAGVDPADVLREE